MQVTLHLTTLDQMLINVYFHLRWLKNKKKKPTHQAFQAFIYPYLLNQFTAHLTSKSLNPVLGAGQIYHHPSLFSLYVLSIWKTPMSKTEIFIYELVIHISCISWNWPRFMVQIRPSKTTCNAMQSITAVVMIVACQYWRELALQSYWEGHLHCNVYHTRSTRLCTLKKDVLLCSIKDKAPLP